MANQQLRARSPFDLGSGGAGAGVTIVDRDRVGIAMIQSRKGSRETLEATLERTYGVKPPATPVRLSSGDFAIAAIGLNAWIATSEKERDTFAVSLRNALGDAAAIFDQSVGLSMLRIGGPRVRDALEGSFHRFARAALQGRRYRSDVDLAHWSNDLEARRRSRRISSF